MQTLSSADTARSVFVDYECLKTRPPQAALLGVLIGSDGEDLAQLIIDPELGPARVARRERTRVVDGDDAVRTLVAMAATDDRRIVGWSYFDRDRMIEACPDLERDITARYVNALQIARPWRRAAGRTDGAGGGEGIRDAARRGSG